MNSVITKAYNKIFGSRQKDNVDIYLEKYLNKSESIVIIDAGAHRGDYFDIIGRHYKIRKAILIEPIPELAEYLRVKYNANNIEVFQNALSNKDFEEVEFQINEYQETSSMLKLKGEMQELSNVNTQLSKKQNVITRTIDSIVEEVNIDSLDLLKIDVQGVEHLVIEGAIKSLSFTKFVWIELSFKPLYIGSSIFNNIYQLMDQNGFLLLEISPGHRSPSNELLQADALFGNPKYF